jgi:hypothetical protein
MGTQNDFSRSFQATSAMSAYRRVTIASTGKIGYASSTAVGSGIIQRDVDASDWVAVRLAGTGSMLCSVTACPITMGDTVYAAVTGQVAVTGTITVGVAVNSATENGTLLEYIPSHLP